MAPSASGRGWQPSAAGEHGTERGHAFRPVGGVRAGTVREACRRGDAGRDGHRKGRALGDDDAIGIAEMLLAMGRAIPPSRWIDTLASRIEAEALEGLF